MKLLGLLFALVMLVPQGGTLTTPDPQPSGSAPGSVAPSTGFTVITLNAHGSVDRNGNGNAGDPAAVTRDVVALAKRYNPRVIALQELCLRQHKVIRAELAKLGYASTMTYADTSRGCNDPGGSNEAGVALYLKTSDIEWRSSHALPWGQNPVGTVGRQPRRIVCARGDEWLETVCTTHLTPGDPDRAAQAAEAARKVASWAAPAATVIAGDFNQSASSVAQHFPTFRSAGVRIDHVLSSGSATLLGSEEVPSSDHPAVIVSVRP